MSFDKVEYPINSFISLTFLKKYGICEGNHIDMKNDDFNTFIFDLVPIVYVHLLHFCRSMRQVIQR